ncbi:APC family permease [Chloroflexota bacterium]
MREIKAKKPGNRTIIRSRPQFRLRRVLTVPALYSAGYGNVGSSIYYALGIVALVAVGATPIALFIAGIFFIFTALTYSEGTAMLPEAGGSASFARHGFSDTMGFVAGWALMLSYVVTISISAFTIPPYLGYFFEPLKTTPWLGTMVSMGIVMFLMTINVVGVKETSFVNIGAALLDVITQAVIVILGLILIFEPGVLTQHMFGAGNWPSTYNLIFGIALASLAYTGVETMSQMAEETRLPQIREPRAMMLMMVTVLIMFSGISIVAFSALSPDAIATEWARDPVAGIANSFSSELLRDLFRPLVSLLAATILLIATNAGLMGISRLAFSMGSHNQLPSAFHRVHSRFRTPYVSIILFSVIAMCILLPGLFRSDIVDIFRNLGALYTFGSLLSFALAHAAILNLRIKKPNLERPFKIRGNIRIRGRDLPITTIIGLIVTCGIWLVIIISQPYSRWVGFCWMAIGLVAYIVFRRRGRTPKAEKGNQP